MKSYTDIEQSKKLAEFLPIESADMYYSDVPVREWVDKTDNSKGTHVVFKSQIFAIENLPNHEIGEGDVYAWSLATLLQLLPLGIYDISDDCDYELEINMIDKMPRYVRLGDIYHSQFPYDFEKDTLLDNIVESIIWLNNNNYLEL